MDRSAVSLASPLEWWGRMMSSPYAQHAPGLLSKGLSPLPIVPGEKRSCLVGWDRYCDEQPSLREILDWAGRYPGAGISVALGTVIDPATNSRLIAFDIDQDQLVETVKKIVLGHHTNHGSLFIAKRGKRGITFFARTIGFLPGVKIKNKSGMAVELLSRGQHTVLPPTIHPDTGQPYRWLGKTTLLTADLARLPVVSSEIIDELRRAVCPPIEETQREGAATDRRRIEYHGEGRFEGVEMVYPGNVNDTQWKMAGAAAWYNYTRGDFSGEARTTAIGGIVEAAMEARNRSGSSEVWDREEQWAEAASQYDRRLEKLEGRAFGEDNPAEARPVTPPAMASARPALEIVGRQIFMGDPSQSGGGWSRDGFRMAKSVRFTGTAEWANRSSRCRSWRRVHWSDRSSGSRRCPAARLGFSAKMIHTNSFGERQRSSRRTEPNFGTLAIG